MTREELKAHCEKEMKMCEFWAHTKDEELNNSKIYQEHKLILELLEQEESILDKVKQTREEIQKLVDMCGSDTVADLNMKSGLGLALEKIDKLIESEIINNE